MSIDNESVINSIKSCFASSIYKTDSFRGESTLFVKKDSFLQFCRSLKQEFGFTYLVDLTAVDYLDKRAARYQLVYIFHRFGNDYDQNIRIRIKVELEENDTTIDSVTPIWSGANWLEREVFDMFGIKFTGHPDPRRILMPEDYKPYPLRKDFDVRNRQPSKESFEKALKEGFE
jgi:NADH-quinone oxidoreductase subunit C